MRDAEALSSRIIHLLHNEDVAKTVGRRGREVICERNNLQKEMDKVDSLYRSLL